MQARRAGVAAVVPVKALTHAKSRMALPSEQRRVLARAFAWDTVSALAASPAVAAVFVVTSDPDVAATLRHLPVSVVPDADAGLGAAVRDGVRAAAAWRPGGGLAVVPADLPCLRADDVTAVVASAYAAGGAFVPDRDGTGTTLLVQPPGRAVTARYGPDSAREHERTGLTRLLDAPVGARHDVDTLADLEEAEALGLGAATAGLTRRWQTTR